MDSRVLIYVESRYKVDRKKIKAAIEDVLIQQDIKSSTEVSVAVVGDRKMTGLNKKYREKEGTTNVLSFPLAEGEQTHLPTDILRLGDIVISYPQVIRDASRDEVLVDEKIDELVRHSMLHLLGVHHQ